MRMKFFYHLVIIDTQRTVLCVKRCQFGHIFQSSAVCFYHPECLIKHPGFDKKRLGVHTRLLEQGQELCVLYIGKTYHYTICSGIVLLRSPAFSPITGCLLFLFHIIHIYGKASGAGLKPAFNFPKSNRLRRLLYPPCGASRSGLPEWFRVTRNTACYLPEANKICLLLADHKRCLNG